VFSLYSTLLSVRGPIFVEGWYPVSHGSDPRLQARAEKADITLAVVRCTTRNYMRVPLGH
jgi:hypothetical protein